MEYDRLLAALAKEIGVERLDPDESNMVHLGAEGTALTIVYEPESRHVVAFSEIADLPSDGREAFYAEALRANWLFQSGAGASLAICPETDKLALNRAWPIDALDDKTFVDSLQRFLATLWRWRKLAADWREVRKDGGDVGADRERRPETEDTISLDMLQMRV